MGNTCVALGVYTDSWLLTSVLGGWLLSSAAAGGLGWKIPLSLPVWVDSKDMFEFVLFFLCYPHIRATGQVKAAITPAVFCFFFQFKPQPKYSFDYIFAFGCAGSNCPITSEQCFANKGTLKLHDWIIGSQKIDLCFYITFLPQEEFFSFIYTIFYILLINCQSSLLCQTSCSSLMSIASAFPSFQSFLSFTTSL